MALLALILGGCATTVPDGASNGVVPPPEALHPDRPDDLAEGTVVWITDGDSVDVEIDGTTIEMRLIGVNAPERDECFYQPSLDYLIDNVKNVTVGVETIAPDQFGRILANLWVGEELLNLTLVLEGLAIGQTADAMNAYSESILGAEEIAYHDGVGLWAPDACGDDGQSASLDIDTDSSQFDPPGPDDDHLDQEIVALSNIGEEDVDIGGYTIRDESSVNRYTLPDTVVVGPDDTIEIVSGCGSAYAICAGRSIWNNDGDMVLVLDRLGNVVARLRY